MKGIFQSRPPLPRYCKTWDVNLALQYIGMGNSPETLSQASPERTVSAFITHSEHGSRGDRTAYTFMLNSNLKQSKPGRSTSELVIKLNASDLPNLTVLPWGLAVFYLFSRPHNKTTQSHDFWGKIILK